MTNPFQSNSDPDRKQSEHAPNAFRSNGYAMANGAAEEPLLDGSEQASRIEIGLADLRTTENSAGASVPLPNKRQPLCGRL
jgi:hypothetical protein